MIVRPVRAVLSALISSCRLCLGLKVARQKEGASWVPSVLRWTPSQAQKDGVSLQGHSLCGDCTLADFEEALPELKSPVGSDRIMKIRGAAGGVGSSQEPGEPLGSGASEPHFCHCAMVMKKTEMYRLSIPHRRGCGVLGCAPMPCGRRWGPTLSPRFCQQRSTQP